MEILSYSGAPCSHVVYLRLVLVVNSSNLHQSKLTLRKHRLWCTKIDSRCGSLRLYNTDQSLLKKHNHQSSFRSLNILGGFKNVDFMVLSGSYDGYVIDGNEDEIHEETFWDWSRKRAFWLHYRSTWKGCEAWLLKGNFMSIQQFGSSRILTKLLCKQWSGRLLPLALSK